jgi:hypothetical protein
MIAPTTPTGSRTIRPNWPALGLAGSSNGNVLASAANASWRADRPQVLGSLLVRQPRPRAVVERLAGRLDRPRDVGCLRLGDGEVDPLGIGVDDADRGVR